MAKSMARLENGIVINIEIWGDNTADTENLVSINEHLVCLGDTYDNGIFYRNGEYVPTQVESLNEKINSVNEEINAWNNIDVSKILPSKIGFVIKPIYIKENNIIEWIYEPDPNYSVSHTGTYIDPIPYIDGMNIEMGLWYIGQDDNIWEALKSGIPTGFDDDEYFDIIPIPN